MVHTRIRIIHLRLQLLGLRDCFERASICCFCRQFFGILPCSTRVCRLCKELLADQWPRTMQIQGPSSTGRHSGSSASSTRSNVCSMCCIAIHPCVMPALWISCHVALHVTSFVTHHAALGCGCERLACASKDSSLIHHISCRESVLVNISSAALCFTPDFFMLGLFGDRFKGSNAPHSSQCRSPSSGEKFVRNLSNKN